MFQIYFQWSKSQESNEGVKVVLYLLTQRVYGHHTQRREGDMEQLGQLFMTTGWDL